MTKHPITPPLELVDQWSEEWHHDKISDTVYLTTQAARWGADQELEACCEWLFRNGYRETPMSLRAARRPKPPSPKEEALRVLENLIETRRIVVPEYQALRHVLEALPND